MVSGVYDLVADTGEGGYGIVGQRKLRSEWLVGEAEEGMAGWQRKLRGKFRGK